MCGLWLMGEGWTHSASGEGGGEDREEGAGGLGKNATEEQGCMPGALMLGNCRAKCWILAFPTGCVIPSCPKQVEGDGQEMEAPAKAELITIKRWWSLQGEVVCR